MAYTDNPLNPIDRIRLKIGDIDPDFPLVTDQWYGYFLDQGYTENAVALEIARKVLAQYSNEAARQVEGQVHYYGKERFDSYLLWLKDLVSNGLSGAPMPYAAGQSFEDMIDNDANPDNVRPFRPYDHRDFFSRY